MKPVEKSSSLLSTWSHTIATYCTLHVFAWYRFWSDTTYRYFVVILGLIVLFAIPFYVIHETKKFIEKETILSSTAYVDKGSLPFPDVTVCHPNVFSRDRMEGNHSIKNNAV